eukprot:3869125-Rhodomonas_salina.3
MRVPSGIVADATLIRGRSRQGACCARSCGEEMREAALRSWMRCCFWKTATQHRFDAEREV